MYSGRLTGGMGSKSAPHLARNYSPKFLIAFTLHRVGFAPASMAEARHTAPGKMPEIAPENEVAAHRNRWSHLPETGGRTETS